MLIYASLGNVWHFAWEKNYSHNRSVKNDKQMGVASLSDFITSFIQSKISLTGPNRKIF